MREWWSNVYASPAGTGQMQTMQHETPALCDKFGNRIYDRHDGFYRAYRVHVRLKPEGAPKRYAGAFERAMWEKFPAIMAGKDPFYRG